MTYRIEINADSLSELAGRVLALAAQFQTTAAPVAVSAPKAPRKTAAVVAELAALVAQPEVAVATAPEAAPVEEPAAPVAVATAPASEPAAPININRDIAPLVVRLAEKNGREAVEELLSSFGVARVSLVPVAQLPELLDLLHELLVA